MSKVICPPNVLEEIGLDELLKRVIELKHEGLRLAQACAAYAQGKLELSYSFANDETYELTTLRVVTDIDTEVPSITEVVPAAVFGCCLCGDAGPWLRLYQQAYQRR